MLKQNSSLEISNLLNFSNTLTKTLLFVSVIVVKVGLPRWSLHFQTLHSSKKKKKKKKALRKIFENKENYNRRKSHNLTCQKTEKLATLPYASV